MDSTYEEDGKDRRDFPAFPFAPYPVQKQLMDKVYAILDRGGVGIIESPTGTGKTLSLLCSSIQWLLDKNAANHHGTVLL